MKNTPHLRYYIETIPCIDYDSYLTQREVIINQHTFIGWVNDSTFDWVDGDRFAVL